MTCAIYRHLQEVNVVLRLEDLPELCIPALQLQYLLLQTVHVALSLRHRCLHVGHYHLIDFSLPALHRLQHFVECLVTFGLCSLGTTLKGKGKAGLFERVLEKGGVVRFDTTIR